MIPTLINSLVVWSVRIATLSEWTLTEKNSQQQ